MRTPPFLLGAALLFWGWQTGLLPVGAALALTFEMSRWVTLRFDLEQDHFNRLWNLCTLLFVGTAMYVFFAKGGFGAINELIQTRSLGVRTESLKQVSSSAMIFVQWLPMVCAPFMIAFVYSHLETIPWTTFSLYYRARKAKKKHHGLKDYEDLELNPTNPFLILVLLSASATTANARWYFPCMSILVLWSIWPFRNDRFKPVTWASVFLVALALALAGQFGLIEAQKKLEALQNRFMNQFGQSEFDTLQSRTAIGSIGAIQQSSKVVLRVSTDGPNPPGLLQEAVFNVYRNSVWKALNGNMQLVAKPERNNVWTLNRTAAPRNIVSVVRYTIRGEVNLALPAETILIDKLDALAIETNRLGAARAIDALKVATYEARYGADGGFAAAPEVDDLDQNQLSNLDQKAVNKIAERLMLKDRTPRQALSAIRAFFLDFTYSTYLQARSTLGDSSPIEAFLLEHRTGHCEYFATSTVHLLRAAGIPARYAVGYSVQEKDGENQWLVRSRHAHAWALAWIDDRWQEVDNTPGNWNSIEAARASIWEPIGDWFSKVWLRFNEWRQGDSQLRVYIFGAGILILGFMAWRQVSGRRWRRSKKSIGARKKHAVPGLDSAFYQIEKRLGRAFAPRHDAEPMRPWIDRLLPDQPLLAGQLAELADLHNRLRFDPVGLNTTDRRRLNDGVQHWLVRYEELAQTASYKK